MIHLKLFMAMFLIVWPTLFILAQKNSNYTAVEDLAYAAFWSAVFSAWIACLGFLLN